MTIVGVVRDSKWLNLRDAAPAMYYRPYRQQAGSPAVRLAMRVSGDSDVVAKPLRTAAQALDSRLVLGPVVPFRDIINRTLVVPGVNCGRWAGAGDCGHRLVWCVGLQRRTATSGDRRANRHRRVAHGSGMDVPA